MTTAPARASTRDPSGSRSRVRAAAVSTLLALAVALGLHPVAAQASAPAWRSPLEPLVVVRGFDPPAGPYAPGHRGVDLGGSTDQPVLAASDGVVTFAGQVGGIHTISISHGTLRTTYQPVWLTTVQVGMAVAGGDVVGRLAPFGSHCVPAPCLHWGAIRGEEYVDPLGLLNPAPSRLLPYWHSEVGLRSARADSTGSSLQATIPEDRRSVSTGVATAIALVGGVLGGVAFLVVRRRSR
jgi:murein DD-endopeptidase MepM/ murein hydrolase activator NlpD